MPQTNDSSSQLDPVISEIATNPGSESTGDRYITTGTGGLFSNFTVGTVVTVVETGPTVFQGYEPTEGDELYIKSIQKQKSWNGTIWFVASSSVTQLSDLSDVSISTPTSENVLGADGTKWDSKPLRDIYTLALNLGLSNYKEVVKTNGRISSIIVWTNSGKTKKIRECIVTRTGNLISLIVDKQYDNAGLLIETLTKTITGNAIDEVLT